MNTVRHKRLGLTKEVARTHTHSPEWGGVWSGSGLPSNCFWLSLIDKEGFTLEGVQSLKLLGRYLTAGEWHWCHYWLCLSAQLFPFSHLFWINFCVAKSNWHILCFHCLSQCADITLNAPVSLLHSTSSEFQVSSIIISCEKHQNTPALIKELIKDV